MAIAGIRAREGAGGAVINIGDYIIYNMLLSYTASLRKSNLTVYLDLINISNNKYLVQTGYPVAGFTVKGGTIFKF